MIMFSRSRDGDLLAGFAQRLGIVPVRGSSGHGGKKALEIMAESLKANRIIKAATVLDGPRGPRFTAKKGMIVLARDTGAPLLPIIMSAKPAITLEKAWDKTVLPLPFSRILVSYRRPWIIPPDARGDKLEKVRLEVEKTLNEMMMEADKKIGYARGLAPDYIPRQA